MLLPLLFLLFLLMDHLFPLDPLKLHKQRATRYYDRHGELIHMARSRDGFWRFDATASEIPDLLKRSVLSFEDRYYYSHPGINPVALARALLLNLQSGRVVSGGSTITMQVARMMQRRPRTLRSKLIELFNALQLEWRYDKETILTRYFNLAPYGGNIEGIKAAAWFYFQKPLHALSISEIAILTTIPKNPNANRPDRSTRLETVRRRVLDTLKEDGLITPEQHRRALREPIASHRASIVADAPHFCRRYRSSGEITTTLDLPLQRRLETRLTERVKQLKGKGVHNAAGVLLHNPTMQVRAYVGSHDLHDAEHGGWNDGVTMRRSPGSTLKPFIYALAFDQGLATPRGRLFDLPLHLHGYHPRNFNKRYYGVVSAEEALQYSLNIPAIELNTLLGEQSLYELLQASGIRSVRQRKSHYGAAIAIGGASIRLLELATLYAMLANGGILREPQFDATPPPPGTRLLSEATGWMVSDILSESVRPALSAYWESNPRLPRLAFKTGTSARSRDLYTVAYTPEYTLAIWLGNFDGSPTDAQVGIRAAAPAALTFFEDLRTPQTWFTRPDSVIETRRCTDPIRLGACRREELDRVIRGVTLHAPCELLRAEVLNHLIDTGRLTAISDLATHRCYDVWRRYPPLMTAPAPDARITFDTSLPPSFKQVPLQCYTYQSDRNVTWLIDSETMTSRSGEVVYTTLAPGKHTVSCVDAAAQLRETEVVVRER